jgi:predicted nucleotidyltransferase
MKNRDQILDILRSSKEDLKNKYPISFLGLFGSYSRNEQNTESDIDILVDFNGKIGIEFIDLAEELETLLGMKVDLVSKRGIKKEYLAKIEKELVNV